MAWARALLLLGVAAAVAATIEPRTGINFPEKHKGGSLAKVRRAGPALCMSAARVSLQAALVRPAWRLTAHPPHAAGCTL
jgi:hypothetical protein